MTAATTTEKFIDVTRDVFQNVCRAVGKRMEIVEGTNISAAYHYDEENKCIAVASYSQPLRQYIKGKALDGIPVSTRYRVLCLEIRLES